MDIVDKSLKAQTLNRLEADFLDDTMNLVQDSFAIIIADNHGLKVLSSYLTMTDVLGRGYFTIENIKVKEKQKRLAFPNYHVIYLIAPIKESVDLIIKDFEDLKTPKYGRVHIFFTHQIKENLLHSLATKGLIKRTLTCKELNVSFFARDKNVFELGFKSGLKMYKMNSNEQTKLLQGISERLFTVAATMNVCPHVQYQASSKLCTILSKLLEPQLEEMSKTKNMKRTGLMLLTDRTIDITTPLLHDYNYKTLIYDLMPVKDDVVEVLDKKGKLNEKDELWSCYGSLHVAQVMVKLTKDIADFQKSDLSKSLSSDMDSFENMACALANIGKGKLKTAKLSLHLKLAQEVNKKYKENSIFNIIELEQDILAGNEKGAVSAREIFKNFTILRSKLQNQRDDLMRILLAIFLNIEVSEKDFSSMKQKLSDEEELLFKNIEAIGDAILKKKSKIERGKSESITASMAQIKTITNSKLNQSMEFSALRAQGRIESIVQRASNYDLDLKDFPIMNWDESVPLPKIQKKVGTKNLFGGKSKSDEEMEELGTLISFTIGGIGYNEIAAIEKLVENQVVHHSIIVGSTSVLTAHDYMDEIKHLNESYKTQLAEDTLELNEASNDVTNADSELDVI